MKNNVENSIIIFLVLIVLKILIIDIATRILYAMLLHELPLAGIITHLFLWFFDHYEIILISLLILNIMFISSKKKSKIKLEEIVKEN